MPDSWSPDRRRGTRTPVPYEVQAEVPVHTLRVRVREVSRRGMVVDSSEPLPLDTLLPFTVRREDGTTWVLEGRVAHTRLTLGLHQGEAVSYLVGIAFQDVPDHLATHLERWLASLGEHTDVESGDPS